MLKTLFIYSPKESITKSVKRRCSGNVEKSEELSITVAKQLSTTASTQKDQVSVANQWTNLEKVIKEGAWRALGRTAKQLKVWIYATTTQLPAKAAEALLLRTLEHHRLRRATTRCARVAYKRLWIGTAEKVEVTSRLRQALSTYPLCFEWAP